MNGRARAVSFGQFWRVWRELLRELEGPRAGVLVEGTRDRSALRALGVGAPVFLVHRGQELPAVARQIADALGHVVILTDWDPTGAFLARRLQALLTEGPVSVDVDQRRRIGRVLRGEVIHLEGLAGWARRRAAEEGSSLEEWTDDPERPIPTG
ncbi:MAG: toprim domain-containing protein [Thermoplasmata archaeon]